MKALSRNVVVLLAASVLAGCSGKKDEPVVHVYNWSDYITDEVLAAFTAKTGIRVVYDVYDSNEMLEAKLFAGSSGYDVVFPTASPYAERHIEAGLYQPLDFAKLPNRRHLDPDMLTRLSTLDPGNRHTVPYMWGTTGLGYNVDQVEAILGEGAATDTWALLFDPEIAGQLASCGISVLDEEQETIAAAMIYLGLDPNKPNAESLQAATELWLQVRPFVRYFHSSRYITDLANGDICLAQGYSGDVLQARDRAEEAGRGVQVDYRIPQEGAVVWFDLMAIPVDAPNAESAHAFINFLMEPEIIAEITNYVSYANANLASKSFVDEEVREDPAIYPDEATMGRLIALDTLPDEAQRARVRAWSLVRTGR